MPDLLQSAVYELIRHFVERQLIARDALRDLHPDYIIRRINPSPDEWGEMRRRLSRETPYVGLWGENNEWHFRLHGIGCHLTHTVTEEIIGFDSGDPKRFDANWFCDHLVWRLNNQDTDKNVEIVRSHVKSPVEHSYDLKGLIQPILDEMENAGLIDSKGTTYRYTLL